MYKSDLVKQVAKRTRLSQRAVADVVTTSLEVIERSLQKGQKVKLLGFGTFYTRKRQASRARNFKTGEPVEVPAMQVADFRAGTILRKAIRNTEARGRKVLKHLSTAKR
jgi:DNA-binding protein HU-beta